MIHRVFFVITACATVVFAASPSGTATPPPGGKWPAHSMERPRPPVVAPQHDGQPVPAPVGATVLFGGKDLAAWMHEPKKGATNASDAAKWKVADGFFEIVPGTGTMRTREAIKGDAHLHIEWATPAEVKGQSQGRGNSGVFLGGFPELQVLDSFENDTYPDGQAAAFYGQHPPLVNASRRPGEWQCYDITIERARVESGKVARKARLTVKHNGVLVQDAIEFDTRAQEGTLSFQDHGNPIRFRNIWVKPLAR